MLERLRVSSLSGIGAATEARLAALGVETVGQLAAFSVARLQSEFGQVAGEQLGTMARGGCGWRRSGGCSSRSHSPSCCWC